MAYPPPLTRVAWRGIDVPVATGAVRVPMAPAVCWDILRLHDDGILQMSVLVRPDPQRTLCAVLAGEWHGATPANRQRYRRLVQRFALRGAEGFSPESYWVGRPLSWFADFSMKAHEVVHGIFGQRWVAKRGLVHLIQDDPDKVTSVPLEEGHVPSLPEQIGCCWFPVAAIGGLGVVARYPLSPVFTEIFDAVLSPVVYSVLVPFVGHYIGRFLRRWPRIQAWIDPVGETIVRGRNRAMAQKTAVTLAERRGDAVMLDSFGDLHLSGIETLLIEQHGFAKVPLDRLRAAL